jgi:hypothetical protein
MSPLVLFMNGIDLEIKILNEIFYEFGKELYSLIIPTNSLITQFINRYRYSNRVLPLLWQFALIPNRMVKAVYLGAFFSPSGAVHVKSYSAVICWLIP